MAKTAIYIQSGESLDYQNATEELISAGTAILFGKRIGVIGGDIPPGETGAVHVVGVFEIPKKSGVALSAGDNIVFTESDGIDKATGDVMGYAVKAANAQDETAVVKILG